MDATRTDPPDSPSALDQLATAEALMREGHFEAALAQAEALLAALPAGPSPAAALRHQAEEQQCRALLRLERFEPAVMAMHGYLDALADAGPSAARAKLLIQMAYGQTHQSRHLPAMRAGHLALKDALALGQPSLAARALERLAVSAMTLGDPLASERFILESLGFHEQSGDVDQHLRGVANALYLYCGLHDELKEAGHAEAAAALLRRSQRVVNRAAVLLPQVRSPFLQHTWRTNEAVWLQRRGALPQAEAQMRATLAEADRQQWHPMRRPLCLELARLVEAQGDLPQAVALLQAMFEPAHLTLRDRLAERGHASLERLHLALGNAPAAAAQGQALAALQDRLRAEAAEAGQRMQDLGELVTRMLAEADRHRLEDELGRLVRPA